MGLPILDILLYVFVVSRNALQRLTKLLLKSVGCKVSVLMLFEVQIKSHSKHPWESLLPSARLAVKSFVSSLPSFSVSRRCSQQLISIGDWQEGRMKF